MQMLTPGRWRGLKTTSTPDGCFTILAFDQRGSYRRMLPEDTPFEMAAALKREVVGTLSPHVSAVLLDPVYGLPALTALSGLSGLLLAYEKTGYSGDSTRRRLDFNPDWTLGKIKRAGASAAKLLVYYHPEAGDLTDEIDMQIKGICDACHTYDLPLFVEPLSYSLEAGTPKGSAEFAQMRPALVRETARRLSALGPDVLKLEFPVDAAFDEDEAHWREACAAVDEACAVPWALLSAGVDFETFERQVRVACGAGASGFLAGRAIWKEIVGLAEAKHPAFLIETAIPRIEKISTIVNASARPWTEFYAPIDDGEDWFERYIDLTT